MSIKLIQLDFPEIILCKAIADGNCYFHSCLMSVSDEYKKLDHRGKRDQAKEFRSYLARLLDHEIKGKKVYDKLSRGNLRDFSTAVPEFSLENMKRELNSSAHVDNKYNELVSNTLNIDIYIIDSEFQDVYMTGDDMDILYHNRPSIVILYSPDHYDLIGYKDGDKKNTIFPADHEFIITIRKRMNILIEAGKAREEEKKMNKEKDKEKKSGKKDNKKNEKKKENKKNENENENNNEEFSDIEISFINNFGTLKLNQQGY